MPSRFSFSRAFVFAALASGMACADSEKGPDSPADTGGLVGNPAPDFKMTTVSGIREHKCR